MLFFGQTVVNGILVGGLYVLVGLGVAIIFSVTRVINFAHGELMMVAMYATYLIFTMLGLDPLLALGLTVPLLFLLGAVIQRLAIEPVLKAAEMNQLLLTFGIGLILSNLALLIFKADYYQLRTAYSDIVLRLSGMTLNVAYVVAFGLAVVVTAGLFAFLTWTDTGRGIRALSQDREAASLMGVDVRMSSLIAFGLGSAAAGAAGTLVMPIYYAYPLVGVFFTLKAFIVVVLGGMGSIVGPVYAGLLLGVAESLAEAYGPGGYRDVVGLLIFLVVLLVRPSGLLGKQRA